MDGTVSLPDIPLRIGCTDWWPSRTTHFPSSRPPPNALDNIRIYLQAVGRYIDVIFMSGTDWGTQKSELFNPKIFEELYVPNIRRMTDYVHQHSDAKTLYHCCGSVFNLMEHFIEAGIDCLNPIQTTTARMEPVELKKRFGGRIVFWGGGAETQTVLPDGSADDVSRQVKQCAFRPSCPAADSSFPISTTSYWVSLHKHPGHGYTAREYGQYWMDEKAGKFLREKLIWPSLAIFLYSIDGRFVLRPDGLALRWDPWTLHGGGPMSISESLPFRSPISKLLRFFYRSRDKWKTKCKAAKRENKSLKYRLAKMTESRDRWKPEVRSLRKSIPGNMRSKPAKDKQED